MFKIYEKKQPAREISLMLDCDIRDSSQGARLIAVDENGHRIAVLLEFYRNGHIAAVMNAKVALEQHFDIDNLKFDENGAICVE